MAQFALHLGRPIVRFEGVTDMTGAERFAGWQLRVPAATAQPLPEHVYYHHQLVGCEVVTADGTAGRRGDPGRWRGAAGAAGDCRRRR